MKRLLLSFTALALVIGAVTAAPAAVRLEAAPIDIETMTLDAGALPVTPVDNYF